MSDRLPSNIDGSRIGLRLSKVPPTYIRALATPCARAVPEISRPSANRGRGECRVPNAPADGVTRSQGGLPGKPRLATALFGGARHAACLEGRRSFLT